MTAYPVTFTIFIRTASGDEVEAFRWTRDERSGVERAKREAKEFGYGEVEAWAVAA